MARSATDTSANMDHIPYPFPSPNPPITIPYHVKLEHLYDHLEFETFAKRKRVSWPSPECLNPGMQIHAPEIMDNAYSLIQSRLFFGLIEEVQKLLSSGASNSEREEYIVRDGDTQAYLTVKALPAMLLEWELQDRDAAQSTRIPMLRNVASCLELAVGYATGLCELAERLSAQN